MISIQVENNWEAFVSKENNTEDGVVYSFNYPCGENYSNCFPYEITFSPGYYFLECCS